jgi:hypothetical protein
MLFHVNGAADMTGDEPANWLQDILLRHGRLTSSVSGLLENILNRNAVEYLSITGRTKDLISAEEKFEEKNTLNQRAN